ncbi:MAG: LacI family DNA-binding transcriptional regulator, partial [Peptococcaceae bacterium]|nr:LacI family DNA-binding transcriptional regulator [Peptococcaceae bacterium]
MFLSAFHNLPQRRVLVPVRKVYTLSDIAKELGVNKATVSKAISGKGNLSAET